MPVKGGPYLNGNCYWGDFDAYADVGGRRRGLVPEGQKHATKNPEVAQRIYDKLRAEYEERRDAGLSGDPFPVEFAATYLKARIQMALRKRGLNPNIPKDDWPEVVRNDHRDTRRILLRVVGSAPMKRIERMSEITDTLLRALQEDLEKPRRNDEGETTTYSTGTVLRHMNTFRAMLSFAAKRRAILRNPFLGYDELPATLEPVCEADKYLTRPEVRAVLENVLPSPRNPWAIEQTYTLFYTGCRLSELNDIRVSNVDMVANVIHIPCGKRRDGTPKYRKVPLWRKHKAVLLESLRRSPRPSNGLLYPGRGKEGKAGRLRKTLEQAFVAAGVVKAPGHHIARHSYCTARQGMTTLYRGSPVNVELTEIAKEIGHADEDLIRRVYGHLERAYERQDELDYYDALPDFDARAAAWKARHAQRVRAALAERKTLRLAQAARDGAATRPRGAHRARAQTARTD